MTSASTPENLFDLTLTFEMKSSGQSRNADADELANYLQDSGVTFVLVGADQPDQFTVGFLLEAENLNAAMVQAISLMNNTVPNIAVVPN